MARDRFDDDRYHDDDRTTRRRDDRDERDRDDRDDRDHYDDDRRYGDGSPPRDDYRDGPHDRRPLGPPPPTNAAAVTSLVLGILSILAGLTAIPGLICGIVGLNKAGKRAGKGHGMALAGTILSSLGILILAFSIWSTITAVGKVREAASRMSQSNNLKQIGLAAHNHASTWNDQLPPLTARPRLGRPPLRESDLTDKLSWRVEILPYIEQDFLYRTMNTDEPWDSPTNRPHAATPIRVFSDPDAKGDPDTRHRVFYGPRAMFDVKGPRYTIGNIPDGTSNTVYVVESGQKVTWTRFGEIKFDESNPPDPTDYGREGRGGFQVAMFDGSVRFVRNSVSRETFKNAIMPDDGNVLGSDW